MKKLVKICLIITLFVVFLLSATGILYIHILPKVVSNPHFISFVQNILKKNYDIDLTLKNPNLKTYLAPKIEFAADKILIYKGSTPILKIQDLKSDLSYSVLLKKVVLKKLLSEDIFIDINSLLSVIPQEQEQKQEPAEWKIDWFNALLGVRNLYIIYQANSDTFINLCGRNMELTPSNNPKYIHFSALLNIKKGKDNLAVSFSDNDKVFIKDNKIYIKNLFFDVNSSKILVSAEMDTKSRFNINAESKKFDLQNIAKLLNSNTIIPYGSEIMSYFKDVKGSFDISIKLTNSDISGRIKLNKSSLKVIPACDLPITVSNAILLIDKNNINIKDIKGTFANSKKSHLEGSGIIKNYMTKFNASFLLKGFTSNEFTKNYASKLANIPIKLTSSVRTVILVDATADEQSIKTFFKIPKGQDILFDGISITPTFLDRVLTSDMVVKNNILDMKKISYYVDREINKKSKNIKPIVNMYGKTNIATGVLNEFGFKFTKPLPSEFLNVLLGQRFFRKGMVNGDLKLENYGKYPTLQGEFTLEEVRVPSQRIYIKSGKLQTNKDYIHLTSNGRFQRSNYAFDGDIKNKIVFPIIAENVKLSLDELDVERFMNSMVRQPIESPNVLKGRAARSLRMEKQAENINDNNYKVNIENFDEVLSIKNEIENNSNLRLLGMRVLPPSVEIQNPSRNKERYRNEATENNNTDEPYVFNPNLLVIKDCLLNLKHGSYKELEFGNLKADLTLDNKGILQIHSNKFDFADGTSALKVNCDLIKQKYSIHLGARQVDSDILATNILGLSKEISGKVSAIIDLNTDETLKMNGDIKFKLKDGSIEKLGYIEYILNFVSLMRNPVAMISPLTLMDLTNIPDGTFKNINGEMKIKDNIIKRMMIKSSSPQLSSFIIGQINLETFDSTLRIYTKFSNKHNGLLGILRSISLNSIANTIQVSASQDAIIHASEISQIPPLENERDEKNCQIFVTKVDGDIINNNFISSLKKIK